MEKKTDYIKDESVDLIHMMLTVAKKWKQLLALLLVGALVGTAIGFLPDNNADAQAAANQTMMEKMRIAHQARKDYNAARDYVETSAFMKLDAYHVYQGTVNFHLAADSGVAYLVEDFKAILQQETFVTKLASDLALENVGEVSDFVLLEDSLNMSATKETASENVKNNFKEAVLKCIVLGADRTKVETALSSVKEFVGKWQGSQSSLRKFTLTELSSGIVAGKSDTVLLKQQEIRIVLNNAFDTCIAKEAALGSGYTLYQKYILTGKEDKLPREMLMEDIVKTPVLVAILFLMAGIVWFGVAYVLTGKVRNAKDVANATETAVLACIATTTKKKQGLDRLLAGLENNIQPDLETEDGLIQRLQGMTLLYDSEDQRQKELVEKLEGKVTACRYISLDAASVQRMPKQTRVALLCQIWHTKQSQLEREAELCEYYGMSVEGTVVLQ